MTWPPAWRPSGPVETIVKLDSPHRNEFPTRYRMMLEVEEGRASIGCAPDCGCPANPNYRADVDLQAEGPRDCLAAGARDYFDLAYGSVPVNVIVVGIRHPGGPWGGEEWDVEVEVQGR